MNAHRRLRSITRLGACLLLAACSVLEPTWTADGTREDGRPAVEVAAGFAGNDAIGDARLRRRIEDYMFDLSRDPTRESSVYDAALELEDLYRSNGYPVAKVAYTLPPPGEPAPEQLRVHFQITEGPFVGADLHLAGNEVYPTSDLIDFWSRRRSGTLRLGRVAFVEAEIRAFVEELRDFYRGQGRLDAVVADPRIAVDLTAGIARIDIRIDEGHQHTIREVVIAGPYLDALGTRRPPTPAGKPYSNGERRAFRVNLRNALRASGHPEPSVKLTATPMPDEPFALRLHVDGDPGRRATIADVQITGNAKTNDSVILDRITVRAGDDYDGLALDATLQRLYRTGLFRKVDIRETPVDGDPTRLALLIQVEENDSQSLELLAGYGSYEQLRGGVRLEERNLFGMGLGLTSENRVSMKGYGTDLTLSDPDFLMTESVLTVTGEYFQREEPSFTDEAAGTTIALARPIAGTVTGRVGYTWRTRTDARAFTALPQDQLVDYVEGKLFLELRNDQRDSRIFPRRGHAEFLGFETMSPKFGASVDLDRLTLRAIRHFTVFDPVNLVLRAEQNVLWPHEGSAQVPLQERWFSGGESSVRSFREAELGPKDTDGQPVGGEYRYLFGVELRAPIAETFEAAVFVDAGNVGSNVQDLSLDDLGYGIGAGLRALLPIGPVRLDAAWNPDRNPGEEEWVLHLSVGYPF